MTADVRPQAQPATVPPLAAVAPDTRFDGSQRYAALDAVRAVAILLVIGHHASFRFPAGEDVLARFVGATGWIGVDLFFALSGFLIAKILLRDAARHDIGGFFRRRVYRIVPIFAVALAAYVAASLAFGHELDNLRRLWVTGLFLNGWAIPFVGVDGVPFTIAWSLSVEEFAYVMLGLAALASPASLRRMVMLFLLVALATRVCAWLAGMEHPSLLYYFVPARLDAIAFGALGAMGLFDPIVRGRNAPWLYGAATGAVMLALYLWPTKNEWTLPFFGYSLFGLAAALWVTSLAQAAVPARSRLLSAIASIGKLSYFIYLFHLFFLDALQLLARRAGIDPGFWPAIAIATGTCYLAARVSWRWLEEPLIRRSHHSRVEP